MKSDDLKRYFANDPAWRRQLMLLRKKYQTGHRDGRIRLTDAVPEECRAAEDLLGRHFAPPLLQYKVSEFEAALRNSVFSVADMSVFWECLDGAPLMTNPQRRAARADRVEAFFQAETNVPHGLAARTWLEALRFRHEYGYFLLYPLICSEPNAARWLHWVCCALDRLEKNTAPEELALCSRAVCGDPHALDLTNPAGRLLLQALACRQHTGAPGNARQRSALYRANGLFQDDISCFTVQRGLQLFLSAGQEHEAYYQLRQKGEYCLLTLSQIERLAAAASPTGKAFLVENQMLFSALCRNAGSSQPLLCTSGQFREATWMLLDMLAESGCEFWYAGDFDPEGLVIADRLWQEYPEQVKFWHMRPQEYRQAVSPVPISAPRLQQLSKLQSPELQDLADALREQKAAGYQEGLLELYLRDLRSDPAGGAHRPQHEQLSLDG